VLWVFASGGDADGGSVPPTVSRLCWKAHRGTRRLGESRLGRLLLCVLAVVLSACTQADNQEVEKSLFRVLALRELSYGPVVVGGTAFKIDGLATVVTNFHVVENATDIVLIYWHEGRFVPTEARVEYADRTRDLALLKAVKPLPGRALPLAMYSPPSGSEAWALGFPGAADALFGRIRGVSDFLEKLSEDASLSVATRTFGNVSGERQRDRVTFIQHQVPISQGSSGGPLIDACGSVIGINTLTTLRGGINGAVSSRELIDVLQLRALNANIAGSRCSMILDPRYTSIVYSAGAIAAVLLLAGGLLALRYLGLLGFGWGGQRQPPMARRRASAAPGQVIEITPIPLGIEEPRRPASPSPASPGPAGVVAKLIPVAGGRPIEVRLKVPDRVVIGREPDCPVVLDDATISRRHCRLEVDAAGVLRLVDLNSGNGTRINGRQLASGTVNGGDRIGLGSLEFRLELLSGSAEPAAAAAAGNGATWQLAAIDEQGNTTRFVIDGSGSKRSWILGRVNKYADLVIPSPSVSARHAMLRSGPDGGLEIQDLGSSNGTTVNGARIGSEWTAVKASSQLKLGGCEIKLIRGS
jgi:pSer/pThr/pTyr-binding forkhead associated (FHA) protein